MFTLEQVEAAHSKVRSGADFPAYAKEIKSLGVTHYETYVEDGHAEYHAGKDYTIKTPAKYALLLIADTTKIEEFKTQLIAHQEGKTDFLTFIRMCAAVGIEKWQIYLNEKTCAYYDKKGNQVLIEQIPQ